MCSLGRGNRNIHARRRIRRRDRRQRKVGVFDDPCSFEPSNNGSFFRQTVNMLGSGRNGRCRSERAQRRLRQRNLAAGSSGTRAVTIGRCASACSIRCRTAQRQTETDQKQPTDRRHHARRHDRGVESTVVERHAGGRQYIFRRRVNAPPNTNKSKYIRLSPAPTSHAKTDAKAERHEPLQGGIVTALPRPRKDFYPGIVSSLTGRTNDPPSRVNARPLPKALRRSYLEELFAFPGGCTCA